MSLTGSHFIGSERPSTQDKFQAVNPANGQLLETFFSQGTLEHAQLAAIEADKAFTDFSQLSDLKRAQFLETIAEEIMALGNDLLERAHLETALPYPRLEGERARTCQQLKLFAELLTNGSWVNAIIDTADPKRSPVPKPDTRSMERPIGPVAVFGASNFPLAFSVAGGDTASALAAGCPVIVKGHPAHPGTSELVALAIYKAIERCQLSPAVFSLIQGSSHAIGQALVSQPLIKAVGFTGSLTAGRALYDIACARAEPIPFYGELGSVNPVFVLADAATESANGFAEQYLQALQLGQGQFCTNPGLLIGIKGQQFDNILMRLKQLLQQSKVGSMLNKSIQQSLLTSVQQYDKNPSLNLIAKSRSDNSDCAAQSAIYEISGQQFLAQAHLHEEVFGPVSLAIVCESEQELLSVAQALKGQLTASIFSQAKEHDFVFQLHQQLSKIAGRVLFNSYPTGVEVCRSMVHGGAYPATTNSSSTSVGTQAIYRFTRRVCYQNTPQTILAEALKDTNPLAICRIIDGKLIT